MTLDAQVAEKIDANVEFHDLLDRAEKRIQEIGGEVQEKGEVLKDFPVRHFFSPGLYCREITMPGGAVLTSKIHKTEHPYVVSQGRCAVYTENGWQEIRAPHFGITKPGTRRFLAILETTVWTTFHPTDLTDVVEIEEHILFERENPLLDGEGET